MKNFIFWDITPCSPLRVNRLFGGTCHLIDTCFALVSCLAYSSTLNMEAICSSETSLDFQWTTQLYIPEDRTLDKYVIQSQKISRLCRINLFLQRRDSKIYRRLIAICMLSDHLRFDSSHASTCLMCPCQVWPWNAVSISGKGRGRGHFLWDKGGLKCRKLKYSIKILNGLEFIWDDN
jgi:hypothetical protein